jgi:hypothetical protein
MTVAELIADLLKYDPALPVVLCDDERGGFCKAHAAITQAVDGEPAVLVA